MAPNGPELTFNDPDPRPKQELLTSTVLARRWQKANPNCPADALLEPPARTLKVLQNATRKVPRHAVQHPPAAAAFGRRRRGVLAGVSGSFWLRFETL